MNFFSVLIIQGKNNVANVVFMLGPTYFNGNYFIIHTQTEKAKNCLPI